MCESREELLSRLDVLLEREKTCLPYAQIVDPKVYEARRLLDELADVVSALRFREDV